MGPVLIWTNITTVLNFEGLCSHSVYIHSNKYSLTALTEYMQLFLKTSFCQYLTKKESSLWENVILTKNLN